jgi:Spy/CpxP family protein refolding chaperone
MKKSVMTGIWMLAATLAFAQPGSKGQAGKQAEKMKAELGLDDKQYASVKGINERFAKKRMALRSDSTLAREKKITELKSLRTERKNEIESVLTPEQETKWSNYKKAQVEKRKTARAEKKAKRSEKVKAKLALTDDQQQKLENVNKALTDEATRLRKDTRLSKDEKRAEMKKLRATHETSVKAILTEEQFQQWKQMRAHHRSKHKRRK